MLDMSDLNGSYLVKQHFLRKILAYQTVDVFVCPSLPTMVRLGEETLAIKFCSDSFVAGELLSVVKCDRFNNLTYEHTQDFVGNLIGEFRLGITDQYTPANPLQKRYQVAGRPGSTDQVSLPVTNARAGFDYVRPFVNIHAISYFTA